MGPALISVHGVIGDDGVRAGTTGGVLFVRQELGPRGPSVNYTCKGIVFRALIAKPACTRYRFTAHTTMVHIL
jgi:hypothetical protein